MLILLVEDSEPLRHLMARILAKHGFEVRRAANGAEGLDCLREFRPDVVITDLMMPVLSGLDLIRRMNAIPSVAGVPVLAITADSTPEAKRDAFEAGASDFMLKPIDGRSLLERVDQLCAI